LKTLYSNSNHPWQSTHLRVKKLI